MALKMFNSILLFTILSFITFSRPTFGNVFIDIYYETQNYQAMKFVYHQLMPVWKEYSDYIDILFIPFGRATQTYDQSNDLFYFYCEHGNDECRYNMVHACAINEADSSSQMIGFIGCLMTNINEDLVLSACAQMVKFPLNNLSECVYKTKKGNHLLSGYGNITQYRFPRGLKTIPTITYNGIYSDKLNQESLTNFRKVVCTLINQVIPNPPKSCADVGIGVEIPTEIMETFKQNLTDYNIKLDKFQD